MSLFYQNKYSNLCKKKTRVANDALMNASQTRKKNWQWNEWTNFKTDLKSNLWELRFNHVVSFTQCGNFRIFFHYKSLLSLEKKIVKSIYVSVIKHCTGLDTFSSPIFHKKIVRVKFCNFHTVFDRYKYANFFSWNSIFTITTTKAKIPRHHLVFYVSRPVIQ